MPHLMTALREILTMHFERDIDNSRLRNDEPAKGLGKSDEPGKGLNRFDRPLGVDSHEPLEIDHVDLNAFVGERDHPFSFFCLRRFAAKRTRLMIKMLNCNWIQADHPAESRNKPLLTST